MSPKSMKLRRFPTPPRPADDHQDGKVTAGVPLVKLIKRQLKDSAELVMLGSGHSVAAERFQRLRTLLVNDTETPARVMVVTSPGPSEGKSLVSMNTALTFAADGKGDVLLVDADLRRPGITRWLDPKPKFGLSEILSGKTELEHALLELENTSLKILPAGTPTRGTVDLLASDIAMKLFADLRKRFRRVIIDTPPIVPFTDADVAGRYADGLLLVARSEKTQRSMFERALCSVSSTEILGVVLNDTVFNLSDRRYYSGNYYYGYYENGGKE